MTALDAPPSSHRAEPRRRRWRATTVVGLLLVTIGLGLLVYVGWEYFGTNIVSKHKQRELISGLEDDWSAGEKSGAGIGDAQALLKIDRFGDDYKMPIVEGFDDDSLASGVGHLPDSADPGEVGNYALAGHRITHGEPFRDFLDLREGDEAIVETRTHIYTYVLDDDGDDRRLGFDEGWVLEPNPLDPGAAATEPMMTLVTCSELFHTDDRQVVFGHLESAERKPAP